MRRLEELIEKLCPDGVEYKSLSSCFTMFSGMGGVTGKWSESGNCQFIDYMNAYKHISIDVNDLPYATVKNLNQIVLRKGDILFTSASETPDECAISSVIERDIKDGIFLDDHLFGLRLQEECKGILSPSYLKYVFRANGFRNQLSKAVRGVTRFYISKMDFMKLEIPVPPLEVQSEIVRILDNFTELTTELQDKLTAELTARKLQYEYYLNFLLYDNADKIIALSDCCESIADGDHQAPPKSAEGIPFITIGNINNNIINFSKTKFVPQAYYDSLQDKRKAHIGDILYSVVGSFGIPVHVDFDKPFVFQRHIAIVRPQQNIILSRYLYYCMKSSPFFRQADALATGAAQRTVGLGALANMTVPWVPIETQRMIVSILDRFDTISSSVYLGLPAEIEARQKQYEYYRDRLLTFKRRPA